MQIAYKYHSCPTRKQAALLQWTRDHNGKTYRRKSFRKEQLAKLFQEMYTKDVGKR